MKRFWGVLLYFSILGFLKGTLSLTMTKQEFRDTSTSLGMSFLSLFETDDVSFCSDQLSEMEKMVLNLQQNCKVWDHNSTCTSLISNLDSVTNRSICFSDSGPGNSIEESREKWIFEYSNLFLTDEMIQTSFHVNCSVDYIGSLGGPIGSSDFPFSNLFHVQQYFSLIGKNYDSNDKTLEVGLFFSPNDCHSLSGGSSSRWQINETLKVDKIYVGTYQEIGQSSDLANKTKRAQVKCEAPCEKNPLKSIANLLDFYYGVFVLENIDFDLSLYEPEFLVNSSKALHSLRFSFLIGFRTCTVLPSI